MTTRDGNGGGQSERPETPEEAARPDRAGPRPPSFAAVFIAVFLGGALILAAVLVNAKRPTTDISQPSAEHVKATGKCAHCHRQATPAIVRQFETSEHSKRGVTCLDCHSPQEGQTSKAHNGFTITTAPTSKNCGSCHSRELEQFLRSRHAAPAWAAVAGKEAFTPEQFAHAMKFHPEGVDRPANALAIAEGDGVKPAGCNACHSIGVPNDDGSIGNCTQCHSRHATSVRLARQPETCGQCHMGPDHSQIEIFNESKHGVLYRSQQAGYNLDAKSSELSIEDISSPNCAVCHMSGLEGQGVTHDVTERLSWYLFAPVSKKRPGYTNGQQQMKQLCSNCHAANVVDSFYERAEEVVLTTNAKVARMNLLMKGLRDAELLTPEPFDEAIEFLEFDYWHYYGRTAKHGAFMGGPDFVQWHGNYELLKVYVEIAHLAEGLYRAADMPVPEHLHVLKPSADEASQETSATTPPATSDSAVVPQGQTRHPADLE